jgi:hypothetical protein
MSRRDDILVENQYVFSVSTARGGMGGQLFYQHSVPNGTKRCDKLKCTRFVRRFFI